MAYVSGHGAGKNTNDHAQQWGGEGETPDDDGCGAACPHSATVSENGQGKDPGVFFPYGIDGRKDGKLNGTGFKVGGSGTEYYSRYCVYNGYLIDTGNPESDTIANDQHTQAANYNGDKHFSDPWPNDTWAGKSTPAATGTPDFNDKRHWIRIHYSGGGNTDGCIGLTTLNDAVWFLGFGNHRGRSSGWVDRVRGYIGQCSGGEFKNIPIYVCNNSDVGGANGLNPDNQSYVVDYQTFLCPVP
jgi:hypothetical protein